MANQESVNGIALCSAQRSGPFIDFVHHIYVLLLHTAK